MSEREVTVKLTIRQAKHMHDMTVWMERVFTRYDSDDNEVADLRRRVDEALFEAGVNPILPMQVIDWWETNMRWKPHGEPDPERPH